MGPRERLSRTAWTSTTPPLPTCRATRVRIFIRRRRGAAANLVEIAEGTAMGKNARVVSLLSATLWSWTKRCTIAPRRRARRGHPIHVPPAADTVCIDAGDATTALLTATDARRAPGQSPRASRRGPRRPRRWRGPLARIPAVFTPALIALQRVPGPMFTAPCPDRHGPGPPYPSRARRVLFQ